MTAGIDRLRTGVPGPDRVLGGGRPEFSPDNLAALPGCDKTTLAQRILFAPAPSERPAPYSAVPGEPPPEMSRDRRQVDSCACEKVDRSIHFIALADDMEGGAPEKVSGPIAAAVRTRGPARVFVASLRAAILAGQGEGESFPDPCGRGPAP